MKNEYVDFEKNFQKYNPRKDSKNLSRILPFSDVILKNPEKISH